MKADETFKTTNKTEIQPFEERSDKFSLRQTALTKDEKALQEYRERWTQGNHNFNRVYLGTEKK